MMVGLTQQLILIGNPNRMKNEATKMNYKFLRVLILCVLLLSVFSCAKEQEQVGIVDPGPYIKDGLVITVTNQWLLSRTVVHGKLLLGLSLELTIENVGSTEKNYNLNHYYVEDLTGGGDYPSIDCSKYNGKGFCKTFVNETINPNEKDVRYAIISIQSLNEPGNSSFKIR